MILAAYHVRHPHQRIVDNHGEVVGGGSIGSHEHGVADDVGVEGDSSADDVRERDLAAGGNAKADDRRFASGDTGA